MARRGRDFVKLYDLVRNQRNKFVTLIGSAKQAAAEMEDRLKLLSSELSILKGEAAEKQKVVSKVNRREIWDIHIGVHTGVELEVDIAIGVVQGARGYGRAHKLSHYAIKHPLQAMKLGFTLTNATMLLLAWLPSLAPSHCLYMLQYLFLTTPVCVVSTVLHQVLTTELQTQAKTTKSSAVKDRDTLRTELHSLGQAFKDKHVALEEQLASIEVLNGVISRAEGHMLRSKKQYEAAIEARNYTGTAVARISRML